MSLEQIRYHVETPSPEFIKENLILNKAYQISFYQSRKDPNGHGPTSDDMKIYQIQKDLVEKSEDSSWGHYFKELTERGLLTRDDRGFYNPGFKTDGISAIVDIYIKLANDHSSR